jgi:hypothetical protein
VLTVKHDGNTYKATCDTSRSFNNATSVIDPDNVIVLPRCDMPVELVGHSIQPFEGKQRDAGGWTVTMWNMDHTLALRKWKDERTPWRQETFIITAVVKIPSRNRE